MTPFEFFYQHAGYSYNPKCETEDQGRKRCARALAKADAKKNCLVEQRSLRVIWEYDTQPYEAGVDEVKPDEVFCCFIYKKCSHCGEWKCVASLSGIGDPSPEYSRVVEAELMLEVE